MVRKLFILLLVISVSVPCYAQLNKPLRIEEEDGDPSGACRTLQVPNSSLTNDGGTTWSITTGDAEVNNLETVCTDIADTEIFIGTGADTGNYAAMSSEATMDNTGAVTLADNVTVTGWALGTFTATELTTVGEINNVIYVDGVNYAKTAAGIEAAAAALPADGGTIILPLGAYVIDATINCSKSNVRYIGSGMSTVLTLANGTDDEMWEIDGAIHHIEIAWMQMDGNKANQASAGALVYSSNNSEYIEIHHNYMFDSKDDAINSVGGDYWDVHHNYIKDCDDNGIYFWGDTHNTFYKNKLDNCDGGGIEVWDTSSHCKFLNNTILNTAGDQKSAITNDATDSIISGNIIDTTDDSANGVNGILNESTAVNTVIKGNRVKNVSGAGIESNADGCIISDNNIVKTSAVTPTTSCITIGDCSDVRITGNHCEGAKDTGIKVSSNNGTDGNIVITGNICKNNTAQGIYLFAFADDTLQNVLIDDNFLFDDQGEPTQDYGIKGDGTGTLTNIMVGKNFFSGNTSAEITGVSRASLGVYSKWGVGTTTIPHGGVGWAGLAIEGDGATGTNAIQMTEDTDDYPILQILPSAHDNFTFAIDAYYDGAWKSSDAGSNFIIGKLNDTFRFWTESGIAQGGNVTLDLSMYIDADGYWWLQSGKPLYFGDGSQYIWDNSTNQDLIISADRTLYLGTGSTDSITLATDGTGDGEVTLPADSIGPAEIDSTTGAYDFGGVTSLEIPNGTDPDVDADGEISYDTDGANEANDEIVRAFGADQWPVGQRLRTMTFTLIQPADIDAADLIPIWSNNTGMTFTIVEWKAWSDDDDVSLELEEITDQTDFTAITTIDAVEIATDGTSVYYASDTTITHAAIEHDHIIAVDFDVTDTPDYVHISITGWFNADVD